MNPRLAMIRPLIAFALCVSFASPIVRAAAARTLQNTNMLVTLSGGSAGESLSSFLIEGSTSKTVLIRAAGPALASIPDLNELADPILSLRNSAGIQITSNNNWVDSPAMQAAVAAAGAMPFTVGSKDAALLVTLNPGLYTARVTDVTTLGGVAMIEVYDTTTGSRIPYYAGRFRAGVNPGAVGFVVQGSNPETLLIRALGPSAPSGIANPVLKVFSGATEVATNTQWGSASTAPDLVNAAAQAGLLPLPDGSADSALLHTFAPGAYTVQIAGASGGSAAAEFEIAQIDADRADFAPGIVVPLTSAVVTEGNDHTYVALAVGRPYPSFQWLRAGAPIDGATNFKLVLTNVQAADAGLYRVVLTNVVGGVTQTVMTGTSFMSTVPTAPVITAQPGDRTILAGEPTTFNVAAKGTEPLSYQWYLGSNAIAGATAPSMTIANVQADAVGAYAVVVTNPKGATTSNPANLNVTPRAPVFTTDLVPQTVDEGQSVTFQVVVKGTEPFTHYEWKKGGITIADAPSAPSHTIPVVTSAHAGNYRVFVTNSAGTTFSALVALTVIANDTTPPVISSLTATPDVLTPPNRQMIPVTVTAEVSDDFDPAPVTKIISVSSNDAFPGRGNANTAIDYVITAPMTLELRAELLGPGGDRVYTITVESKDSLGNTATRTVNVTVPRGR